MSKKKITQKKQYVIAPFCSNLSLLRMWELDNWSILVSELQKLYPNYFIYIIGAPSDQEQAQQIINALEHKNNVKNCCGKLSFRESSLLIQQSCCFVGIDSAPLHMARLLSVPSVSLWGATDPFVLLRDFVDYPEVVIYTKKECSPCVHTDKVCKLPKGCLNTISVSTVLYSIPVWKAICWM